ncbi:MAG: OmpA family protein [Magnetococcus sp. DMHC-6]
MRKIFALWNLFLLGILFLVTACSKNLVVILPNADGTSGSVVVQQGGTSVVLDKPYAATKLDGQAETQPIIMDSQEVKRIFAESLAAQPLPPVSFNLYYKEGGTQLMPDSVSVLDQIFQELEKRLVYEITVIGHTDRVGSVQDNDALALKRAKSVMQIMIDRGVKTWLIDAAGRGEREPLIATNDEVPQPRNRRTAPPRS